MLKIISHELIKIEDVLEREMYDFTIQIELPANDTALGKEGTELIVTYNHSDKDIQSYAFVPKNNPKRPTISVSFTDDEYNLVSTYCKNSIPRT